MLKLNYCKIAIILVILQVIYPISAIISEEMEFSCTGDEQCQYYEAAHIHSSCLKGHCQCYNNNTNTNTYCKPNILHTNNIIGGNCPCNLPNARCHPSDSICYCEVDYIPTMDKRRCIPKEVALGEICETDEQCLASNTFSHCANDTKICTCNNNFHRKDTICLAQTKLRPKCTNGTSCTLHGPNKLCLANIDECVCEQGYVSASNSEDCLPGRNFDEECLNEMQCSVVMGPGASCENGECRCKEEFVVVKKKTTDGDAMEDVCEPLVQIGHYCSLNEHCRNGHLNEDEQLMLCDRGECVCRFGIKNQTPCSTSMASSIITSQICSWFMSILAVFKLRAL